MFLDPKTGQPLDYTYASDQPLATGVPSARAGEVLLAFLARETHRAEAIDLGCAAAGLAVTAEDLARARQILVALLASEDNRMAARALADALAGLDPAVADLGRPDDWPLPPAPELLATTRRNSPLADWLAALPMLRPVPGDG